MTGFSPWLSDRMFTGQLETPLLSSTIGQYDVIWFSLIGWNHLPIAFENLTSRATDKLSLSAIPFFLIQPDGNIIL